MNDKQLEEHFFTYCDEAIEDIRSTLYKQFIFEHFWKEKVRSDTEFLAYKLIEAAKENGTTVNYDEAYKFAIEIKEDLKKYVENTNKGYQFERIEKDESDVARIRRNKKLKEEEELENQIKQAQRELDKLKKKKATNNK